MILATLAIAAFLGALCVELCASIKKIREEKVPSPFGMGYKANAILFAYYLVCATIAVIVSTTSVDPLPSRWDGALFLKSFYIGFATSTNLAFINKLIPNNIGRFDDIEGKIYVNATNRTAWKVPFENFRVYLATRL